MAVRAEIRIIDDECPESMVYQEVPYRITEDIEHCVKRYEFRFTYSTYDSGRAFEIPVYED